MQLGTIHSGGLPASGTRPRAASAPTPEQPAAGSTEVSDSSTITAASTAPPSTEKVGGKRSGWASLKARAHQLSTRVALSMAGTAAAVAPETALMHMLSGQFLTPALGTAARLGIMDALPATSDDLATQLKLNAEGVERLLRACAAAGAVKAHDDGTFSRTRMGEYLTSDHPRSLKPLAVMLTDRAHWESWGQLEHSVRTGEPAANKVLGVKNVFDHYAATPDEAARFNDGMTAITRTVAADLGKYYDFSSANRIIDIGGGHGHLLSAALAAAPNARGTLCDLPDVLATADPELVKRGVDGRVDKAPGSFFQAVPGGGDIYMMKTVLHDWTDAQCVQILSNVRKAMPDHARLLIIEAVRTEQPGPADFMNLHMLVMAGGKERSQTEFEHLLAHSGMAIESVIPTAGPFHIIEAKPV